MHWSNRNPVVLMVDDDDEDIYLTQRAFTQYREELVFKSVKDGEALFDYLNFLGEYANNEECDYPDVILLDINIPKENGFEILKRLRGDEKHGHLPVTMLTTSSAVHDVRKAYQLGASSFISKSVDAQGMKAVARQFCEYWLDFARIPSVC